MFRLSSLWYLSLILIMFYCISTGCSVKNQGYSIKVRVKNQVVPGKIYLKKYDGDKFSPIDSLPSDKNGEAEFKGNNSLFPGMYSTGIKDKYEVNFFISSADNQHFYISFDPENIQQIFSFRKSPENEAFAKHLMTMETIRKQIGQLQSRMQQNYQFPDSVQAIRSSAKKIQGEAEAKIAALEQQYPGSMLALFLRITKDPEIPEPVIPLIAANREQAMQKYYYNYAVAHFFDNFDFSDARLIKLPVFKQKMVYYFTQLVTPQPDSLKSRVDELLSKTIASQIVHARSIQYLYNLFRESPFPDLTGLSIYIAEKYIIVNPVLFNDSAFIAKVRNRVEKAKLNPVGSFVTNLTLHTPEGKILELTQLKAPLTVLYFFNPGCESCHAVTDKLSSVYRKYRDKGLKVFAVYVDRNNEEWIRYIGTKKLDWINVYDPEGTEAIDQKFDVNAIPMIYLLDKDKKVIGRDIPIDTLEGYMTRAGL